MKSAGATGALCSYSSQLSGLAGLAGLVLFAGVSERDCVYGIVRVSIVSANAMSRLKHLAPLGQSVWLDFIQRSLLTSGQLRRLVADDGVAGLTSNPSIFEKAIGGSPDYAAAMGALRGKGLGTKAIYEALAIEDLQAAADELRPVYDATAKRDGYVSLEVSPHLARDTAGTLEEARRLWAAVGRPNLMIKVPGTPEGMGAIEDLIADGINVNVTLLFARSAYRAAAEAFIRGLERRLAAGQAVSGIASVASFFVSRIDTLVDAKLGAHDDLKGKAAIANAKLAYADYESMVGGARWKTLREAGAMPQRLLWASTSTKNPAYRDVIYVEELIGPDTVNTLPMATLDAFRDHGQAKTTLRAGVDRAEGHMVRLRAMGIDFDAVTAQLLEEGLRLFSQAFDSLLASVEKAGAAGSGDR